MWLDCCVLLIKGVYDLAGKSVKKKMKWINVVARNLFRKLPRSFLKKHIQRQEPSETS